jgi:hypothetical protein
VLVEDHREQREEDDLAPRVRVEARDAVGAAVVHVIVGDLAAAAELLDDQRKLLVGELIPHPVNDLRAVPDHGHVRLVVVREVRRALRVPARDRGHALTGRPRVAPIARGKPREREDLRALDEAPRTPQDRRPGAEERVVILQPIGEEWRLLDLMRLSEELIRDGLELRPALRTSARDGGAQLRDLVLLDVDARVGEGQAIEPHLRRWHLKRHRIAADLEAEDRRLIAAGRPRPPVAAGVERALGEEHRVGEAIRVQHDVLKRLVARDDQAERRSGVAGLPREDRRVRPRAGEVARLARVYVRMRMTGLLDHERLPLASSLDSADSS